MTGIPSPQAQEIARQALLRIAGEHYDSAQYARAQARAALIEIGELADASPDDQGANQSGGPRLHLHDDVLDGAAKADDYNVSLGGIAGVADVVKSFCDQAKNTTAVAVDQRWLAIARNHFQHAFMALRRAVHPKSADNF